MKRPTGESSKWFEKLDAGGQLGGLATKHGGTRSRQLGRDGADPAAGEKPRLLEILGRAETRDVGANEVDHPERDDHQAHADQQHRGERDPATTLRASIRSTANHDASSAAMPSRSTGTASRIEITRT